MTEQEARDEREALEEWSFQHRPILSMRDGSIASCKCLDRVFINGQEDWDSHVADALIAAGYRKHPEPDDSSAALDEVLSEIDDLTDSLDDHVTIGDVHDTLTMLAIRIRNGWFPDAVPVDSPNHTNRSDT